MAEIVSAVDVHFAIRLRKLYLAVGGRDPKFRGAVIGTLL